MFEKICPGEEFLPKAPNPEDIIFDDGETGGEKETGAWFWQLAKMILGPAYENNEQNTLWWSHDSVAFWNILSSTYKKL